MPWVDMAPQNFDHGVPLVDVTPQQLEWMTAETERCLRTGAWGARVLLYMDDFLVLAGSKIEAFRARELASWVLNIHQQAKALLSQASRHSPGSANRRGVVAQTAGSEPVERSKDLEEPHKGEGEVNWVNPPWSLLDEAAHKLREESFPVSPYLRDTRRADVCASHTGLAQGHKVKVYWPVDDAWYSGTVGAAGTDGLTHVVYDDGDEKHLDMSKEKYEMQGAALDGKTVGNYQPKAKAFMDFCDLEGRQWLPATEATGVCAYIVFTFVTFGRPDTGVSMQRQHISIVGDTVSVALHKEKGRGHVRLKRQLTIHGAHGLVQLLQHWEQVRDALWDQSSAASSKGRRT
ncbi:hypothetical protein CYMTET_49796 [Cymbomonas tetramitiformis]|uniref:Tudor domain-containing protein n=1 Tax=Cymbomonas tetramitiformis TaxID=36881 RepID=A0AAE0BQM8_9CHLO|nr:hypothetical protein CYMTET_49796 [Cymbomonas tetramitiformis]